MEKTFKTEQEKFWAGEFGDAYAARNVGDKWVASNVALFARALRTTSGIGSVVELGANVGLNMRALRQLLPEAKLSAVEINASAAEELRKIGGIDVHVGSLLEYRAPEPRDLALIKGVLIHIAPDMLRSAYEALYASSRKYVLVIEYYNPSPVSIDYRGHKERLFKRDFAGEMLDAYPDLRLADYGFAYHRDPNFPQDDLTWFLLEKRGAR